VSLVGIACVSFVTPQPCFLTHAECFARVADFGYTVGLSGEAASDPTVLLNELGPVVSRSLVFYLERTMDHLLAAATGETLDGALFVADITRLHNDLSHATEILAELEVAEAEAEAEDGEGFDDNATQVYGEGFDDNATQVFEDHDGATESDGSEPDVANVASLAEFELGAAAAVQAAVAAGENMDETMEAHAPVPASAFVASDILVSMQATGLVQIGARVGAPHWVQNE
jgi:hypothetical protein